MEQEKKEKSIAFDVTSLDTYKLITLFINILSLQAWQHMGLIVKPNTNKIEKDLERAKMAIDCITFLIVKLENHVQNNEKESLKNLLTDLEINYARIVKV